MSNNPEGQDAPDPAALMFADVIGRVLAMQILVTRLVASHAEMFPEGVASRWLANIDAMVESVDNTMDPGYVHAAIKMYLRDYLEKAQTQLDSGLATNREG